MTRKGERTILGSIKEKRNGNEKKSTFSEAAKRTSGGEKKCVEENGRWSWSLAPTAESAQAAMGAPITALGYKECIAFPYLSEVSGLQK